MRRTSARSTRFRAVGEALIALILLGAFPCMAIPMPRPVASRGLAVVDSLIASGHPEAAADQARDLLRRFVDDPLYRWQIRGRLGLALIRSGKAAAAVGPLEDAIRERPRDASLHRSLAYALKVLGRRGRALAEYEAVVQLVPTDPQAHLEYGQTLLDFRDYRGADRELKLAAGMCGNCVEAERALANLDLARGEQAQAIPHLRRVWAAERSAHVRLLLATALAGAGQGRQALALLDSVPRGQLQAGEWRILVQVEKDNQELGSRWSALAVALSPGVDQSPALPPAILGEASFWAVVAANLQRDHHPGSALTALDKALALEPDNVLYHHNRVSVLLDLGREKEARKEWQEVLRLDPAQTSNEGHSP